MSNDGGDMEGVVEEWGAAGEVDIEGLEVLGLLPGPHFSHPSHFLKFSPFFTASSMSFSICADQTLGSKGTSFGHFETVTGQPSKISFHGTCFLDALLSLAWCLLYSFVKLSRIFVRLISTFIALPRGGAGVPPKLAPTASSLTEYCLSQANFQRNYRIRLLGLDPPCLGLGGKETPRLHNHLRRGFRRQLPAHSLTVLGVFFTCFTVSSTVCGSVLNLFALSRYSF